MAAGDTHVWKIGKSPAVALCGFKQKADEDTGEVKRPKSTGNICRGCVPELPILEMTED